jgi:thiol-disulfide isomerase/thioredoxin
MRKTIAITTILFMACTIQPQEKEEALNLAGVKTNLTKMYKGEEDFVSSKDWTTREDFRKIFADEYEPEVIVFTASNCGRCLLFHQEMRAHGVKDKVSVLNVNEPWVHKLAQSLGIKAVPVVLVAWYKNPQVDPITVYTSDKLIPTIKHWIGQKNR